MSKKRQNSNLKYVCAIAMSLFSLIALFVGTFAWFQSVRALQNNADNFNVRPATSMITKVSVYNQNDPNTPYVFNSQAAVVYGINEDKVEVLSGNQSNINIRYYSSLSEQADSTLLYLFEIGKSTDENQNDYFSINVKTDTTDSADAGANNTEGSLVYKEGGYAAHPLVFDVDDETKAQLIADNDDITEDNFGLNSMSSIISFDVVSYTSALTETNGTYNLVSDFQNVSSKSFVNQVEQEEEEQEETNNQEEYVYSYTTYDISAFTWNKGDQATCPKYVAVVCHYNAAAIQYIFNLNLGNPAADYEDIRFTCDWYYELR